MRELYSLKIGIRYRTSYELLELTGVHVLFRDAIQSVPSF